MKRLTITLFFSILLLCIPIASYQSAQTIELKGVQWEKDWLDILIVGGTEHYRDLAVNAVGGFMYEVISTTGEYSEWHYNLKTMTTEEYDDLSWYLKWDIIIMITDDYKAAGGTGKLGKTVYLQQNGYSVPNERLEKFNRADIIVSTMYNATHYTPDFVVYNMIAHEFGHALGLGHPTDEDYYRPTDLMSGAQVWNVTYSNLYAVDIGGLLYIDQLSEESQVIHIVWRNVGYKQPSPLDIAALVQIYGTDGWNYKQYNDRIPQSYGQTYMGE